jgi:REP element-mobilizing transposase RayT
MAREIRFIPQGSLVEITTRTFQGRFLLHPSKQVRDVVLGVIGRAQKIYGVVIHTFVFVSNHYHMLVTVNDAKQLADFAGYVNGNIARKVAPLVGWANTFWGQRYKPVVISGEEAAQIKRLRYLSMHGVKEGFVLDPTDWPGAHCIEALTGGSMKLEGNWFNGTKAHVARQAGKKKDAYDFPEEESIVLTPLPCWSHLDPDEYRRRICEMVADIEKEATERHRLNETAPTGVHFVFRQDPQTRPRKLKRSPAPAFHAASEKAFKLLREAKAWFLAAYREAAAKLRDGEEDPRFPEGCFPPALPFVAFA